MCPLTLNEPVMFARCALTPFFSFHVYGGPGPECMTNIYIEREKGTVDVLRRLVINIVVLQQVYTNSSSVLTIS